jgi:hypothetical protein
MYMLFGRALTNEPHSKVECHPEHPLLQATRASKVPRHGTNQATTLSYPTRYLKLYSIPPSPQQWLRRASGRPLRVALVTLMRQRQLVLRRLRRKGSFRLPRLTRCQSRISEQHAVRSSSSSLSFSAHLAMPFAHHERYPHTILH